MREILFRAKRIDNGEWVEGYFWRGVDHIYVIPSHVGIGYDEKTKRMNAYAIEVNYETLCQYTGLNDKNGNRIWENDIVKHEISDTIGTVKWYQEDYVGWCVDDIVIDEQQFTDEMWNECEVIGNIFDNLELLKGDQSCTDL